jgi:hemerythrin-like domain-containing protein
LKATEILMEEHRVIENVLTAIALAARTQRTKDPLPPQFFADAVDFIRGFADGCHHRKEEDVLFKALARHGFSESQGPLAVMLHEHEVGRAFTRAMADAVQRLEHGDESARVPLAEAASSYAALLHQHIAKENQVLFKMADRALPPDEQAEVEAAFDRIERDEADAHRRYEALAQSLAARAGL